MNKHLEKEGRYKPILTLAFVIEADHKDVCKRIYDIMVSDEPISMTPSFQKIIGDKIKGACPALEKSRDLNLIANNIYIDFYVFKIIFEKVSRKESSIILNVVDNHDACRLMYQNSFALGKGNQSDMNRLKRVVEELVHNNDIKQRVEGYTQLHKQLSDNGDTSRHLATRSSSIWQLFLSVLCVNLPGAIQRLFKIR
jgi:hypothetical protein